jgi:hypothetical protein
MNKSVAAFTTILLLMTVATAVDRVASASPPAVGEGIQIQSGKLLIGDQPVLNSFSLVQSKFAYLFIYVPHHGLITVSSREFPGAREAGRFVERLLEMRAGDLGIRLESATPILRSGEAAAWVAVDTSYSLTVESVMVGYGDDARAPYAWERYVRSNR